MFKNLNARSLGVSGRQSELIELALTYGFRGMDVDIHDLAKRAESQGEERAKRYLAAAPIKIGGFELPIGWAGEENQFKADLARLAKVAALAGSLEAVCCHADVVPASDELPYRENFEQHRTRLAEIADVLAPHKIRLALGFLALPQHRADKQFPFIHQADALLTLVKTIGKPNVGAMIDTWNWQLGGGDLSMITGLTGEQIAAVRLAAVPVDADPSTAQSITRALPGQGREFDFPALIAHLAKSKFNGPVTLAPHGRCFSGMTRDAIVQKAANMLDDLWVAAGLAKVPRLQPAGAAAVEEQGLEM